MEKGKILNAIINDDKVMDAFSYLLVRWEDEKYYEDIEDYGKALYRVIAENYPNNGIGYMSATKSPFGLKITIGGNKVHIYAKVRGAYFSLMAKVIA